MFFEHYCHAILTVSKDISAQVVELTRGKNRPIFDFIPSFYTSEFNEIQYPDSKESPFKILFAGRLEENKGAFYIAKIAAQLKEKGENEFCIDICGDGGAFEELKKNIAELGLHNEINLHGYCLREEIMKLYSTCHVVLVPTTSRFIEGFNRVVAEGVLAKRPVISSSACPAASYFPGAVFSVSPDNIEAYVDAIIALRRDGELYQKAVHKCNDFRPLFDAEDVTWRYACKSALSRQPE